MESANCDSEEAHSSHGENPARQGAFRSELREIVVGRGGEEDTKMLRSWPSERFDEGDRQTCRE